FQAEDGIRDYKVTGVQTCALPICIFISTRTEALGESRTAHQEGFPPCSRLCFPPITGRMSPSSVARVPTFSPRMASDTWTSGPRSEERRGGKGWRPGGGRAACKRK